MDVSIVGHPSAIDGKIRNRIPSGSSLNQFVKKSCAFITLIYPGPSLFCSIIHPSFLVIHKSKALHCAFHQAPLAYGSVLFMNIEGC